MLSGRRAVLVRNEPLAPKPRTELPRIPTVIVDVVLRNRQYADPVAELGRNTAARGVFLLRNSCARGTLPWARDASSGDVLTLSGARTTWNRCEQIGYAEWPTDRTG